MGKTKVLGAGAARMAHGASVNATASNWTIPGLITGSFPQGDEPQAVPVHGAKLVAAGTLRALIRDAGLTVEQFVSAL